MILQGGVPIAQGATGANTKDLQDTLTLLGYSVPAAEVQASQFGVGTLAAVKAFQADAGLTVNGTIDQTNVDALNALVEKSTFVVSGSVSSPGRASLGRLSVEVVDKNVGGDQTVATGVTGDTGALSISCVIGPPVFSQRHKTKPDLQVRVSSQAADGTTTFLAASEVIYNAPSAVTLDVVLPSTATGLPSEYEALTAAVAALYPGQLENLKQTDQQQDITFLAHKTGWDATLVGMAAQAAQFSSSETVTIKNPPPSELTRLVSLQPAFYYALFRAGAPANADQLFQIPSSHAAAIWTQAINQGVIPAALQTNIPGVTSDFQALAANRLLNAPPKFGISSLSAQIGSVLTDPSQQSQFASLLLQNSGDWNAVWTAAATAFGQPAADKLKVVVQLNKLTRSVSLASALLTALPNLATSLDTLASAGFYDAAKWSPLIGTTIPPGIPGATPADYAAFLAAQVKLAFPTAVLSDQIAHGTIPISGARAVASEVSSFLSANQDTFAIGVEPVEAFIARAKVTAPSPEALRQIKAVQRVYALTTKDEHIAILLNHNLDSAYAITRYDAAGFARAFGPQLGGAAAAEQIHKRARQISFTVASLALRYGATSRSPAIGSTLGIIDHATKLASTTSDPPPSAALADLFGSLDYCNCSDCNSILSPAAYFVDLLHFLDQPSPTKGLNPQTDLFSRRPDLEYLALSCDNTNTSLPYIDIVNETLEAFVAGNLSLANFEGFNTSANVSSAELIAAPQNVNDAAYAALKTSFYPAPLPFNRPIELLRQHMKALGVALPDAMIKLRASDAITDNSTPASYGWSDILIEQLGMSREEFRLFADPALLLGDLYGLARASGQTDQQWNATTLATLQGLDMQSFSTRTGVDYTDIVSILKCRFINPGAALIERVQALGVTFAAIQALHNDPVGNAAAFIAGLPAGLDYSQYGGTNGSAVVSWLTGPNYDVIMGLITIGMKPNADSEPNDCSGASWQLFYANPDTSANLLTATDFLKLIRFIRLRKKLQALLNIADNGEAIRTTDALLSALYPAADLPVGPDNVANDSTNRPKLDDGFRQALLRAGFVIEVLNRLSLNASALNQLLICWSDIDTNGRRSLYAQLFLTPTLLQQDPGAQATTVSPLINTGDRLTTTIDTVPVVYAVLAGDTPQTVASKIAAAINATTTTDPVSGLPLSQRFHAAASNAQVVITAGFHIAWNVSGSSGGTLSPAGVTDPTAQTATAGGTPAVGETFTVIIDTIPVAYVAKTGETAASIATGLATTINATTAPHPYSGLPLNSLLAASAAGAVISVKTADTGPPFDLTCSIELANTGTYVAGTPIPAEAVVALSGTVTTGNAITINLNTVALTYTVAATDTSLAILATSLANTINGAVQVDPTTTLPFSQLLHATSNGITLTIRPIDSSTSFIVTISSNGTELFVVNGPSPASQTAVVSGTFPAGAVLTTTINGADLFQTVVTGDTANILATKIAAAINAPTLPDPATGSPLSALVSATASGGTITVTSTSLETAFTLVVTAGRGSYTVGRLNPPFADNGFGAYLADPTQTLFGHEPLLCAACNLTGAEFALITAALGFDAITPLTLANVSALFRYGWLPHALGSSVAEFLALRRFSGLDPFAPLDPSPIPPAEPPAIRFIGLVQALQKAGLALIQALYLIWNQDPTGTLAPDSDTASSLAMALRADFAAVESQFQVPSDPDGSITKQLMTAVYGAAETDFFFGLLNQTFSVSVPLSYGSPVLPLSVLAAADTPLSYNDAAKTLSGFLTPASEAAIAAAVQVSTTDATDNLAAGAVTITPQSMANIVAGAVLILDTGAAQETIVVVSTTATSFTTTTSKAHNGSATQFPLVNDPGLSTAVAALAAASQQAIAPFFAIHPALQASYTNYVTSTAPATTRFAALIASLRPILVDLRKQEQALAAITAQIGCDPSYAPALLQDAAILHGNADATLPAINDLTAIETGGLTGEFFLGNDPTQPADQTVPAAGPASVQTATLAGTITTGAVLTTTINGQAVGYTVTAQDTSLDVLAGHVAALINAAPINAGTSLVAASASGATITLSPSQPLTASSLFTLACTSSTAGLTYTAGHQLPTGPGGSAIAARWSGYVTPSQTGNYAFRVIADPGATVRLKVGGTDAEMAEASGIWSNQAPIALNVGQLTSITLEVSSIKTTLAIGWSSPPTIGWTSIPLTALYPDEPMSQVGATYVRFLKAVSLATALSLTANEIAWLGTDITKSVETNSTSVIAPGNATFTPASMANIAVGTELMIDAGPAQETVTVTANTATTFAAMAVKPHNGSSNAFSILSVPQPVMNEGWLISLPGVANADPANNPVPDLATAAKLTSVLVGLLNFARLKQAISRSDERLLNGFQSPLANLPNGQSALLTLTGWAQVSVQGLCARFFGDASLIHLADVRNFARVYDAMALVQACRLTAPSLLAAITNAPTPTTVGGLQSALRALFSPSDWLNVIKPINDSMRQLQRDALVKWILQALPGNTFKTADDLYALFLIDPSTEPAVPTSRIRLALSVVQLYIERILQGLEPQVSAGDIDPQLWAWMKRYRVWQANREVFLWPENWLYPQLRDDQSPIFQQMMSSLLQSDITDDAAIEAYLDYLSGLHDVAKLEPCGMYYVPATADTNEITYVVARSFGANRTYYFRELRDTAWSPWSEVPIDCEDMPLTPIVWNGRLLLFWLKAIKDSSSATQTVSQQAQALTSVDSATAGSLISMAASASQQVPVQAILFWAEYYNGKWQPTKSSDPRRPTTIGSYNPSGPNAFEAFRSRTRIVPATCTGAFAPRFGARGGHGPVIKLPSVQDALILAVDTPQNPYPRLASTSGGAGFLLHNTQSTPTPLEDVLASLGNIGMWLDVPAPHREIEAPDNPLQTTLPPYSGGPSDGNLTMSYFSTNTEVEQDTQELSTLVLQYHWLPRIIEAEPGLTDIWTAPFFYEDRRNLFYVTSTSDQTTFRGPTFGIGAGSSENESGSIKIPLLQISQTAGRTTVRLEGRHFFNYRATATENTSAPSTTTPIIPNAAATAALSATPSTTTATISNAAPNAALPKAPSNQGA
jgi:Neuraminidase-like domain/Putative peptidoglycan binding domain/Salmonella virulence plasmid 28.1kDa A protein